MKVVSRGMLGPNDQVGRLIGKGGCTIRQMQDLSNCHLEIAKQSAPGSGLRQVTVTGLDDQIGRAVQLVRQKLSGLPLITSSGYVYTPVPCVSVPLSTDGLKRYEIYIYSIVCVCVCVCVCLPDSFCIFGLPFALF